MPTGLTSDRVWKIVEKQRFAVLGTVSRNGRPLTTGIVYAVKDRHLYIPTNRSSQKAKNIQGRPHVSLCVTIEKRIPFLPWIKIPAATITFRGEAALLNPEEVEPRMRRRLTGRLKR
ncbi:MAG: pyridoxamine 5'-phosphate oxidase family protein, partial [Nitrospinota bacterium]